MLPFTKMDPDEVIIEDIPYEPRTSKLEDSPKKKSPRKSPRRIDPTRWERKKVRIGVGFGGKKKQVQRTRAVKGKGMRSVRFPISEEEHLFYEQEEEIIDEEVSYSYGDEDYEDEEVIIEDVPYEPASELGGASVVFESIDTPEKVPTPKQRPRKARKARKSTKKGWKVKKSKKKRKKKKKPKKKQEKKVTPPKVEIDMIFKLTKDEKEWLRPELAEKLKMPVRWKLTPHPRKVKLQDKDITYEDEINVKILKRLGAEIVEKSGRKTKKIGDPVRKKGLKRIVERRATKEEEEELKGIPEDEKEKFMEENHLYMKAGVLMKKFTVKYVPPHKQPKLKILKISPMKIKNASYYYNFLLEPSKRTITDQMSSSKSVKTSNSKSVKTSSSTSTKILDSESVRESVRTLIFDTISEPVVKKAKKKTKVKFVKKISWDDYLENQFQKWHYAERYSIIVSKVSKGLKEKAKLIRNKLMNVPDILDDLHELLPSGNKILFFEMDAEDILKRIREIRPEGTRFEELTKHRRSLIVRMDNYFTHIRQSASDGRQVTVEIRAIEEEKKLKDIPKKDHKKFMEENHVYMKAGHKLGSVWIQSRLMKKVSMKLGAMPNLREIRGSKLADAMTDIIAKYRQGIPSEKLIYNDLLTNKVAAEFKKLKNPTDSDRKNFEELNLGQNIKILEKWYNKYYKKKFEEELPPPEFVEDEELSSSTGPDVREQIEKFEESIWKSLRKQPTLIQYLNRVLFPLLFLDDKGDIGRYAKFFRSKVKSGDIDIADLRSANLAHYIPEVVMKYIVDKENLQPVYKRLKADLRNRIDSFIAVYMGHHGIGVRYPKNLPIFLWRKHLVEPQQVCYDQTRTGYTGKKKILDKELVICYTDGKFYCYSIEQVIQDIAMLNSEELVRKYPKSFTNKMYKRYKKNIDQMRLKHDY